MRQTRIVSAFIGTATTGAWVEHPSIRLRVPATLTAFQISGAFTLADLLGGAGVAYYRLQINKRQYAPAPDVAEGSEDRIAILNALKIRDYTNNPIQVHIELDEGDSVNIATFRSGGAAVEFHDTFHLEV